MFPTDPASAVIDAIDRICAAVATIDLNHGRLTIDQQALVDNSTLADLDTCGLRRLSNALADTMPDTFEPIGAAINRALDDVDALRRRLPSSREAAE